MTRLVTITLPMASHYAAETWIAPLSKVKGVSSVWLSSPAAHVWDVKINCTIQAMQGIRRVLNKYQYNPKRWDK